MAQKPDDVFHKSTFDKISPDKRDKILNVAVHEFASCGFENANINTIAKKAGVSRTAFYRNYTSKDDVVREIGMQVIDKLSVIINNIKSKDDIHGMLIEFFSQIKEEKEQVSILLNGNLSLQMLFPNARIIENVIPSANLTDHYKMVAIDSAVVGLVGEWILNDCDIPESELADIIEPQITL